MNTSCRMIMIVCALFAVVSVSFADLEDHWGPCVATPAVVNPAVRSPLQEVLSLRGSWDFVTDPRLMGRHRMGKGPGWNEPDWEGARAIEVPGCWEAQGVGEPGMSQVWSLPFDCIPRPLHHVYMGTARYLRSVTIPPQWLGKRIWLKVGGVRTEAWLWVNQRRVAHLNTYCGAYKYDVTDLVSPGETAEIIATVCNDTPSRKGCMAAFHRWGGFYRDIELEATPLTWIDDVWVRSDMERKAAQVHVSIRHEGNELPAGTGVRIAVATQDGAAAGMFQEVVRLDEKGRADLVCEVPLSVFRAWTPETPHLYLAEVTLFAGDMAVHGWTERFGIRKLEARGDQFFLNGRPYMLRGFGDDYIYPMTLISPADRAVHAAHLQIAHRAGFNYVRHHTHCEIPEFFEAADETGILVQPELPYYHDIATEGFSFDPQRDIEELYRHYRRYVSFASYSTGNEGHLGSPLDAALYQWAKRTDPDRLFQHQDGGCNTRENADYFTPNGYGLGTSIVPWPLGSFDKLGAPFIAHEYLNLGVKMDPRLAPQFTGAIPAPRSLEGYEGSLRAAGLDRAWGDACLDAAHALQGYYQKRGIEQARRDPACDGYSYWTLIDVLAPQEGTFTGQGFLNAFWEEKPGGLTLDQFRRFNGPTVILADIAQEEVIAVSGDTRRVAFWLSHYGGEKLTEAHLSWRVKAGTEILAEGLLLPFNAPTGALTALGECSFNVPELRHPVHAVLEASVDTDEVFNTWDFWFFPERTEKHGEGIAVTEDLFDVLAPLYPGIVKAAEGLSAGLVVGSWDHPDLLAACRKGIPGLMIGPADGAPNISLGWWSLGDQNGTAFARHGVFGDFPHDGKMSPLWFRLIKRGLALPFDPVHGDFALYAVGEGKTGYFAHVFRKTDAAGQNILMTYGLDVLSPTPEGMYLLDALIAYCAQHPV